MRGKNEGETCTLVAPHSLMLSPGRKGLSLHRLGSKQTPTHREAAVLLHRPSPATSVFESTIPLVPHHSTVCLLRNKPVGEGRIPHPLPSAGQGFRWHQYILAAAYFLLCKATPIREHRHRVSGASRLPAEQFLKSWYYYSKQESTSKICLGCRAA